MRGFVKTAAGLAAAGLWVWYYRSFQWWPGVSKPALYLTGGVAAFFLVRWLVDKAFEVFTGDPADPI